MERDIYHSAFDTPYQHPGNYSLTHHGILGMKWGVWNEETARRYGSFGWTTVDKKTGRVGLASAQEQYDKFGKYPPIIG